MVSITIVTVWIIYLHCVSISEALRWFVHINCQGADMAFEEGPFEAKQPLHSYHYSGSNETHDTLNSFYHDLFEKCVCCSSCPTAWAPL